jgi:hypothetical protein
VRAAGDHPAHHSIASALQLVRELALALRVPLEPQAFVAQAGVEA